MGDEFAAGNGSADILNENGWSELIVSSTMAPLSSPLNKFYWGVYTPCKFEVMNRQPKNIAICALRKKNNDNRIGLWLLKIRQRHPRLPNAHFLKFTSALADILIEPPSFTSESMKSEQIYLISVGGRLLRNPLPLVLWLDFCHVECYLSTLVMKLKVMVLQDYAKVFRCYASPLCIPY